MATSQFDEIVNRFGTYCVKYDLAEKIYHQKDIIPLWVADMDFKTPDIVSKEMQKIIDHGIYSYTYSPDRYYESFINWCKNRHEWEINKNHLLDVHGLIPGLNLAIRTLTDKGDKIIIQPPVYHPFRHSIENNNRMVLENHLIYDDGKYSMDFDLLESQAKDASMLVLCSPHNPVARVWKKTELEKLAKICLSNNLIIVSDDIHADIIYFNYKHIPIASISDEIANNTVTLMAPGKTFNLQGLQSAFIVTHNESFKVKMKKERESQGFMLNNIFSMASCTAAYEKGEEWLNDLLIYLEGNRDYVIDFLDSNVPFIKPIHPEGTYVMWLDCREMKIAHEELKNFFNHKAKVGLIDGTLFDKQSEGFFRLNFATPRSILEKALNQIKNSFALSE